MEQYTSHSPRRRECWKGHDSKANVRSAIRYARRYNAELRIFMAGTNGGFDAYTEIPSADWDAHFVDEA